ncbi:hypothetical protein RhiirC2_802222 [Rhizophagus irregularis]|uniref:Uncharacterized protein n=1 Tax=Rhizophagus irregularis TaxID=588596 RepID=A0A2N1M1J4_9GLOM|nr:hypothetical protein RhiirC2_802222 [Rhizophagus irregularis]
MLCIRPAEIKTLQKNEERASGLLVWIQEAISSGQLRDPGKSRVLWFNTFLKKNEFFPETGKLLLPSSLRKLGAVFAVISNCAKNLSEAITIAITDQKYSSDSALSEQEVIRHTEKIAKLFGLDEQNTEAYKALFGQIWALEKKLKNYHFEYVKLKKKVNLLEAELDDLNECVDRKAVVDLIHEIVPLLIGNTGRNQKNRTYRKSAKNQTKID